MPAEKIDVQRLVKESGLDWHRGWMLDEEENRYSALTRLVMEECAKVCEEKIGVTRYAETLLEVAATIRARMP